MKGVLVEVLEVLLDAAHPRRRPEVDRQRLRHPAIARGPVRRRPAVDRRRGRVVLQRGRRRRAPLGGQVLPPVGPEDAEPPAGHVGPVGGLQDVQADVAERPADAPRERPPRRPGTAIGEHRPRRSVDRRLDREVPHALVGEELLDARERVEPAEVDPQPLPRPPRRPATRSRSRRRPPASPPRRPTTPWRRRGAPGSSRCRGPCRTSRARGSARPRGPFDEGGSWWGHKGGAGATNKVGGRG